MKLIRTINQTNPGRRVDDWFKRRSPVDEYFHIAKVAPGVYELVAGPTIRVGVVMVDSKVKNIGALVVDGTHPQKYLAETGSTAKQAPSK